MQTVSTSSRLHRAMGGVERFQEEIDFATLQRVGVAALLDSDERVLGVYWNRDPSNFVAITKCALIFPVGGTLTRIAYDDMDSSLIEGDKANASEVQITRKNGEMARVVIDGGEGKFRDVFSFGRFMDRVIGDRKQK